jgi:hypothetical protein
MAKKRDFLMICIFIILLSFLFFVKAEQSPEKVVQEKIDISKEGVQENKEIPDEKEEYSNNEEIISENDGSKKLADLDSYEEQQIYKYIGELEKEISEENGLDKNDKEIEKSILKNDNEEQEDENEILINIDEIVKNESETSKEENWQEIKKDIENNESKEQEENISNDEKNNSIKISEDYLDNLEEDIKNITDKNLSEKNDSESKIRNTESEESYVDIDKILSGALEEGDEIDNESKKNITQDNLKEKGKYEKRILYKEGKKQIEIEVLKNCEINIEKTEQEEEFIKQIKISSDKHIDKPLRVYTDLSKETERKNIKIYWRNENKDITNKKEHDVIYYDEDGDGLIDRISWIVPHLSEQFFDVIIDFSVKGDSDDINIEVLKPLDGQEVNNPIEFKFNISYINMEDLICDFLISGISSYPEFLDFNPNDTISLDDIFLINGEYNWMIYCEDFSNYSINETKEGSFFVNESFSVEIDKDVYIIGSDIEDFDINIDIESKESNTSIELMNSQKNIIYRKDIQSSYQNFKINTNNFTSEGVYKLNITFNRLSKPYSIIKEFSVAKAELVLNKDSLETDEEIKITSDIKSPIEKIRNVILDFGDGKINSSYNHNLDINNFNKNFYHEYSSSGEYTIKLLAIINGEAFNIEKTIKVVAYSDNRDPDISLVYPEDDEIIRRSRIKFEYEAEDNVKVDNCTFRLYNVSESDGLLSYDEEDLLWDEVHKNFDSKEKDLTLDDFDEGDYYWEVECYDNSSNYEWEGSFFRVIFQNSGNNGNSNNENVVSLNSNQNEDENYEKQDLVENILSSINDFLKREKEFGIEQKRALEDLGLIERLNFYKKRLLQIDQDLKHNIKFISDQDLKQQRIIEMNQEIDDIQEEVPQNIEVLESYSFVKNSVEGDMNEIIEDYMKAQNTETNKRTIKKLAQNNLIIQQYLNVKTEVKKIRMTYPNREEELTLIKKELTLKNESYKKILEIIPKEIEEDADEITFLANIEIIKQDPIIEVDYDELEGGKLIYYVGRYIDLKDIEQTQTILFDEEVINFGSGITGFFIFELGEDNPIYYGFFVILLMGLIYLSTFIFQKLRFGKWKKEPNVVRSFELMSGVNRAIKQKDLEKARVDYHKLKEIYPLLPENCKKFFYKKIKRILLEIDRRDIFNLVREYEDARRDKRQEDKIKIYEDIKKIYKRLPKKYREKVYERVIKREF